MQSKFAIAPILIYSLSSIVVSTTMCFMYVLVVRIAGGTSAP
jgi:hypothetical protein